VNSLDETPGTITPQPHGDDRFPPHTDGESQYHYLCRPHRRHLPNPPTRATAGVPTLSASPRSGTLRRPTASARHGPRHNLGWTEESTAYSRRMCKARRTLPTPTLTPTHALSTKTHSCRRTHAAAPAVDIGLRAAWSAPAPPSRAASASSGSAPYARATCVHSGDSCSRHTPAACRRGTGAGRRGRSVCATPCGRRSLGKGWTVDWAKTTLV
jgi:hypothetical protein